MPTISVGSSPSVSAITAKSRSTTPLMTSRGRKKPLERLLGTTDYVFELTREKEYEKIGYEIQRNNYQDVIIRAPATVEWNRINRKFKDQRVLRDFIKPDLIVTLIDAEWAIKLKLETLQEADPFLIALKQRNHTLYDILSWMNEEVSLSEDWARYMGVPHYVIAVGEPPRLSISWLPIQIPGLCTPVTR